jgi:signal transduction histidine kinase
MRYRAPPGRMSRVSEDAWQRGFGGWHAVFGALAVLCAVLAVIEDNISTAGRIAALVVLASLAGWYAVAGAKALRTESGGLRYLVVAAPLTVALFALLPAGALMLFVLYPHIWALLPTTRAVVGTVAVLTAIGVVFLSQSGLSGDTLLVTAVYTGVGLVIALLLGLWITRIIDQSRQRAQLLAELAATREELAAVSREAGALAERARVARDIHDTLAQGFASVLLQLEAVAADLGSDEQAARRHLAAAEDSARANLAEARSLVGALTPPDLRASSLVEALRRLVERTGRELGADVAFDVTGTPRALPANQEIVLFRGAQEALTNVGKHADARTVEVGLGFDAAGVCLLVRDDGRGFVPGSDGFGLAGMRARVLEVGGLLAIEPTPGGGVTVRLELCP